MTWNATNQVEGLRIFPGGRKNLALGQPFIYARAPQRVYWETTRGCDLAVTGAQKRYPIPTRLSSQPPRDGARGLDGRRPAHEPATPGRSAP